MILAAVDPVIRIFFALLGGVAGAALTNPSMRIFSALAGALTVYFFTELSALRSQQRKLLEELQRLRDQLRRRDVDGDYASAVPPSNAAV